MYGRAVLGNAIDKGGSWVYYIVLALSRISPRVRVSDSEN